MLDLFHGNRNKDLFRNGRKKKEMLGNSIKSKRRRTHSCWVTVFRCRNPRPLNEKHGRRGRPIPANEAKQLGNREPRKNLTLRRPYRCDTRTHVLIFRTIVWMLTILIRKSGGWKCGPCSSSSSSATVVDSCVSGLQKADVGQMRRKDEGVQHMS